MSVMCELRVKFHILSSPSGAGASMGVILGAFSLDFSSEALVEGRSRRTAAFHDPLSSFLGSPFLWAQLTFGFKDLSLSQFSFLLESELGRISFFPRSRLPATALSQPVHIIREY